MKTCEHCGHAKTIPGTESLACFRYPPTAFLINVPGRIAGQVSPSIMPGFTPVTKETPACGEFKEISSANDETSGLLIS